MYIRFIYSGANYISTQSQTYIQHVVDKTSQLLRRYMLTISHDLSRQQAVISTVLNTLLNNTLSLLTNNKSGGGDDDDTTVIILTSVVIYADRNNSCFDLQNNIHGIMLYKLLPYITRLVYYAHFRSYTSSIQQSRHLYNNKDNMCPLIAIILNKTRSDNIYLHIILFQYISLSMLLIYRTYLYTPIVEEGQNYDPSTRIRAVDLFLWVSKAVLYRPEIRLIGLNSTQIDAVRVGLHTHTDTIYDSHIDSIIADTAQYIESIQTTNHKSSWQNVVTKLIVDMLNPTFTSHTGTYTTTQVPPCYRIRYIATSAATSAEGSLGALRSVSYDISSKFQAILLPKTEKYLNIKYNSIHYNMFWKQKLWLHLYNTYTNVYSTTTTTLDSKLSSDNTAVTNNNNAYNTKAIYMVLCTFIVDLPLTILHDTLEGVIILTVKSLLQSTHDLYPVIINEIKNKYNINNNDYIRICNQSTDILLVNAQSDNCTSEYASAVLPLLTQAMSTTTNTAATSCTAASAASTAINNNIATIASAAATTTTTNTVASSNATADAHNIMATGVSNNNDIDIQLNYTSLLALEKLLECFIELLLSHLPTLIPTLLILIRSGRNPKIRVLAVKMLGVLGQQLPYHYLHPYKNNVLKVLGYVLDDNRRVVRLRGAKVRNLWYTLSA